MSIEISSKIKKTTILIIIIDKNSKFSILSIAILRIKISHNLIFDFFKMKFSYKILYYEISMITNSKSVL